MFTSPIRHGHRLKFLTFSIFVTFTTLQICQPGVEFVESVFALEIINIEVCWRSSFVDGLVMVIDGGCCLLLLVVPVDVGCS